MKQQRKVISIFGILLVIIFVLIIVSCSSQQTANPKVTGTTLFTETNMIYPTASFTPTLSRPTKTLTLEPTEDVFISKKEIFNYFVTGEHSYFEGSYQVIPENEFPKLVIYEDGQMIITGEDVKQKFMTQEEVATFINEIEKFGFSNIQTNGKNDPSDPLYNFGENYDVIYDSPFYCVSIAQALENTICYEDAYYDYLVPQMKEVITYLNNYHPENTSLYIPEKILLYFSRVTDFCDIPKDAPVYEWNSRFPDPEGGDYNQYYISSEMAGEIAKFLDDKTSVYVNYHEKYYYLIIQYILPHENINKLE